MQDEPKKSKLDTEFSEELNTEDQALQEVQNAFFEMYSQAGNYDKEKE